MWEACITQYWGVESTCPAQPTREMKHEAAID
jgi:hypothetical protein